MEICLFFVDFNFLRLTIKMAGQLQVFLLLLFSHFDFLNVATIAVSRNSFSLKFDLMHPIQICPDHQRHLY